MDEILETFDLFQKDIIEINIIDKFYRQLSGLYGDNKNLIEEIVKKTWDLIDRNVISKDILYLCLLVNRNLELLDKCLNRDKAVLQFNIKDPYFLYDYTVYTKRHWLNELFKKYGLTVKESLPKSVYDKFVYLQVVNIINDSPKENFKMPLLLKLVNSINNIQIDNFWTYYLQEIQCILKIVDFFKGINPEIDEFDVLRASGQNCILEVASQYLNLYEHNVNFTNYFFQTREFEIPHDEDIACQYEILESYTILIEFLKLIIPHPSINKHINVNDVISDIKTRLVNNIKNPTLQIELLQLMFAVTFIKHNDIFTSDSSNSCKPYEVFICNEKEVRIILFAMKFLIEEMQFKKLYQNSSDELNKLNHLHKMVTDATWRLELIANLKSSIKCEAKLLYYMLAEPESLINICLKFADFTRASQVLKIFGMESSPLAQEIVFTEKLQELKETFKRTTKMREIHSASPNIAISNANLQFDDIAEEYFQKNPINLSVELDEIIKENMENYPFLDHYKSENELFMNIFDMAITQTETVEDSRALLHLASKYNTLSANESDFARFSRTLLILFNEVAANNNLTLPDILINPGILLDKDKFQREENFYNSLEHLYNEFCTNITLDEVGSFNKDHPSHKSIQKLNKHCIDYLEYKFTKESGELIKYIQKLFNYLKAFSKVLYIENDSSDLIANGKNTPYFDLLLHNRSELMGKLLFQQNLDPTEFEKYFGKLKLDFLYHVTGNCFPTINLHSEENVTKEELYPENILYTPTKAIITYIQKRNWLLALILNEMYNVEDVDLDVGESRIQNFLNYLRLPKIENLQTLFKCNEIATALQNEISYQKVHDYIIAEIGKHDFTSSTRTSNNSAQSLETAEEICEDELKTTNWKKLYGIIDSIPENQIRKQNNFTSLKDMVLSNLVRDAFECEYYKFTLDIWDRTLRTNLLLENMKAWPVDFCIKIIKAEISRFDQEHDDKIDEMKLWLKHIEHSKKIMNILGVPAWSHMYDMCLHRPKDVINQLLNSKEIDLLIEFLELHEVSQTMLLCIDEEFLENAFDLGVNLISIGKILNIIPYEHSIKVCENLLSILKNVNHLQFITGYLRKNTNHDSLINVSLSLNILSVFLPSEFDQQLLLLLRDPMSIIEVLIMNTKLDKLAAVLDVIKPIIPTTEFNEETVSVEKIDDLLRHYAEKSLDFRVITQPNPRLLRTPDHKLMQSLDSLNLDPSTKAFAMPEDVPAKEDWIPNTDVIECMCCMNVFFSMFNRRHHCRRCGRVVCASCSQKRMIVPSYGDILVRTCLDCYNQTFQDRSISDDTLSIKSILEDYWMLTDDFEHNRIVKEEFSYEFAPSVSLCLSLMKLHSRCDEYSKFLLEQCKILLKLLIPTQELMQEIDYLLIIRMLKSLAMAAKMASQDTSLHYGSTSADMILNQAELVGLLAERGCLNLLSTSNNLSFIDAITLRRLTDKLLEREQWNLALEVSTKAGLDKSGVFVAWGKSCLKAGSLAVAREKFSKCLEKNAKHDLNPPLLNEIIKTLETKKEAVDEEIMMSVDNLKLLGSTMTLNQSITSTTQPDGAVFIRNKLKNLKNIEMGYYAANKSKCHKSGKRLEEFIYDECVYYLNKYGTPLSVAEFHVKYGNFDKVLNCIKALDSVAKRQGMKSLGPDIFVAVYMICLKDGTVESFQSCMSEMDSTLNTWREHLMQTCNHLKKQNFLNSLYQLQQYMGDFVRAAMTCVRFYEEKAVSYTDLSKNNHFLLKSEEHFKQAEEQDQWVEVSTVTDERTESNPHFEEKSINNPMIKRLTHEEIEKHTATIRLQIEVTRFLSYCENNGVLPMEMYLEMFPNTDNLPKHKITIPTLFGSLEERKYLALLCIICGKTVDEGFELSFRIINKFDLKPLAKLYNKAGNYFAQAGKYTSIAELVTCIQQANDTTDILVSEMCDNMLISTVTILSKMNRSEANIEELIKLISDKSAKIAAHIEAKQLKAAYFLATKYKKPMDIRRILREAEMSNQINIKILCQKALQRFSQSSTTSSNN